MPAVSQKQRGLIFSKRNQYGSISKTPDKWKWVWEDGWENRGKLPKFKKNRKKVEKIRESFILSYDKFTNEWFKFGGNDKVEPKKEDPEDLVCKDCGFTGSLSKFKPYFTYTAQCPKCKSKNIVTEKELKYNIEGEGTSEDWGWDLS